jgi:hypothetical protein
MIYMEYCTKCRCEFHEGEHRIMGHKTVLIEKDLSSESQLCFDFMRIV